MTALIASLMFVFAGVRMAALESVAGNTVAEEFYNAMGVFSMATGLALFAAASRWR